MLLTLADVDKGRGGKTLIHKMWIMWIYSTLPLVTYFQDPKINLSSFLSVYERAYLVKHALLGLQI